MGTEHREEGRVDLDLLAALEKAATPAPWLQPLEDEPRALSHDGCNSLLALDRDGMAIVDRKDDAALIVALRNAAPAIIKILRAAEDARGLLAHVEATSPGPQHEADAMEALAVLRAALGPEVPS